jgi:hypothetical protein
MRATLELHNSKIPPACPNISVPGQSNQREQRPKYITVTLNGVLDATGASGDVVGPQMGVLIGD